jgi:uncharacterized protein (DUF58 family)
VAKKLFDDDFLRRLQRLALLAKRIASTSATPGQRKGRRLGDGLEFADHREYSAGDDPRFMDWPYFARMEKLLLRLFHEHTEGAVAILLDASASMHLGEVRKFDKARRMAAALAYVAMASLDRVHILPFAEELSQGLTTGRNRGQILGVLEYLERLEAGGQTKLSAVARQYVGRFTASGTVIILSDLVDQETELSPALALLRHHKDEVILIQVVDRCDADPPALGPTQLSAVEESGRLSVETNAAIMEQYRRQWHDFCRELEKTAMSRQTTYVQAPTTLPFERLVLEALKRAGVLQG